MAGTEVEFFWCMTNHMALSFAIRMIAALQCLRVTTLGTLAVLTAMSSYSPTGTATSLLKATEVTLMIWQEDHEGVFREKQFKAELALRRKELATPVRAVYLPVLANDAEKLTLIQKALRPGDRISALIISTHGTTGRILGQTHLAEMGGFGRSGAYGLFKSIIEKLSSHWNASLFVYLDSCSTLCGLRSDVKLRVKSLYKDFAKHGVNKMVLWGAHQQLLVGRKDGKRTYGTEPDHEVQELSPIIASVIAVPTGALMFFTSPELSDFAFMTAGWAGVFYLSKKILAYFHRAGTSGSLVHVEDGYESITDMDVQDPRLTDFQSCTEALTR